MSRENHIATLVVDPFCDYLSFFFFFNKEFIEFVRVSLIIGTILVKNKIHEVFKMLSLYMLQQTNCVTHHSKIGYVSLERQGKVNLTLVRPQLHLRDFLQIKLDI